MSDRQRRAAPNGDEPLLRALRELGTDHEPDLSAITRRMEAAQQPRRAAPRAVAGRSFGRSAGGSVATSRLARLAQHSRPVLLPAAAVLLVMGGVVLVTTQRPDPGTPAVGGTTAATAAPSGTPASGTPVPTATAAPTSAAASTPGRTRAGTAASATQPPAGPTTTASSPAPTAKVSVTSPAAEARNVDLSEPGLLDWVALGARSDLKQVRAKTAAADPQLSLDQPAEATSVGGPFRVSWTDGIPEQDHLDAGSWLSAPARPGLTVNVAAAARPRTLTLYAGAAGTPASVTVSGTGLGTARTRVGASSPDRAMLITISLPAGSGPIRVRLHAVADDAPTARVFLAGVTLR
jgi:hypothetical protein